MATLSFLQCVRRLGATGDFAVPGTAHAARSVALVMSPNTLVDARRINDDWVEHPLAWCKKPISNALLETAQFVTLLAFGRAALIAVEQVERCIAVAVTTHGGQPLPRIEPRVLVILLHAMPCTRALRMSQYSALLARKPSRVLPRWLMCRLRWLMRGLLMLQFGLLDLNKRLLSIYRRWIELLLIAYSETDAIGAGLEQNATCQCHFTIYYYIN